MLLMSFKPVVEEALQHLQEQAGTKHCVQSCESQSGRAGNSAASTVAVVFPVSMFGMGAKGKGGGQLPRSWSHLLALRHSEHGHDQQGVNDERRAQHRQPARQASGAHSRGGSCQWVGWKPAVGKAAASHPASAVGGKPRCLHCSDRLPAPNPTRWCSWSIQSDTAACHSAPQVDVFVSCSGVQ
jgi:hypothetical protein